MRRINLKATIILTLTDRGRGLLTDKDSADIALYAEQALNKLGVLDLPSRSVGLRVHITDHFLSKEQGVA